MPRILTLALLLVTTGDPPAHAQSVLTLVRQLEHKDPKQRRAAARDLGKLGPKALTAADALGNIGPAAKAAVPALRKAFDDSGVLPTPGGVLERQKRTVRRAAATALAGIGAPALPTLLKALSAQNATHRQLAAQGIGGMGAAAANAIPALTRALKDRAEPVRKAAGRSIRQIQYQIQYQRKLEFKRQRRPTPAQR